MSENCPYCGTNGNQEDVCEHYLLSIWEENFGDDLGAPLWMPLEVGEYAWKIKNSLDTLFEVVTSDIKFKSIPKENKSLYKLVNEINKKSKENWQEDYEDLSDLIHSECNEAFNEYIIDLHRHISPNNKSARDTISHSPGLSWETVYLWSKDPNKACQEIVRAIEIDLKLLQIK